MAPSARWSTERALAARQTYAAPRAQHAATARSPNRVAPVTRPRNTAAGHSNALSVGIDQGRVADVSAGQDCRIRHVRQRSARQYLGIAPVTEKGGNSTWVHWRLACPVIVKVVVASTRKLDSSSLPSANGSGGFMKQGGVGQTVGRSLHTPPSLPAPRTGSRSYVHARYLAAGAPLHLDYPRLRVPGCVRSDRPRMATAPDAVRGLHRGGKRVLAASQGWSWAGGGDAAHDD